MIKIYYPDQFFDKERKGDWIELLRSRDRYLKDGNVPEKLLHRQIEWVASAEAADIYMLPMDWSFYYKTRTKEDVFKWIKKCGAEKPILTQSNGDYGIKVPVSDVWQLKYNLYKSRANSLQIASPAIISDPMSVFFSSEKIVLNPYRDIPIVGFCGQSVGTVFIRFKEVLRIIVRNFSTQIGLRYWDTSKVLSTSSLRERVLRIVEASNLKSNFIRREKYRAGANTEEMRRKTTLEYYQNQLDSDYIICVRGSGNFSIRFYETLAMGRIPIFVNTDCVLPMEDTIDWKQHVVWIEQSELSSIPQKLAAFHKSLGPDGFKELQQKNRELWIERLQYGNFMQYVFNKMIDKH